MTADKIHYRRGYKYQLRREWRVQTSVVDCSAKISSYVELWPDGVLIVRAGYAWDGASGPTIDSRSSMRGSLAHDALYQLMREGLIPGSWRGEADRLLYDLCVSDGMWPARARLWLWAVRNFGGPSAARMESRDSVAP